MPRTRLARILAAAFMAALLLPQVAIAAPTTTLPTFKLACSLVVPNPLSPSAPNRAIVCKWVAPEGVAVARYHLWRTVDGGSRQFVARKAADAELRHADFNIRTGKTYRYTVVAVNEAGSKVAKSNVAKVYVGRAAEPLSLQLLRRDRRGRDGRGLPLVGHDARIGGEVRAVPVGGRRRARGHLSHGRGRSPVVPGP